MKLLRKINRGLILTVFLISGVIVYLVLTESAQNAAKPVIQRICADYIQKASDYAMLPQQYHLEKPEISESALNDYIEKMKNDMMSFYPSNTTASKYLVNDMELKLRNQSKGEGVVYSFKKKIETFKSMDFNGQSVTVEIADDTNYDGPSTLSSSVRMAISQNTTDTIMLQKISGRWKVVSANLQLPSDESEKISY